MEAPKLCDLCGTFHHRWQPHVFRSTYTETVGRLGKPDVSRSCAECETKAREIDELKHKLNALTKELEVVNTKLREQSVNSVNIEPPVNTITHPVNIEAVNTTVTKSVNRNAYFREKMRERRKAEKERKAKTSE